MSPTVLATLVSDELFRLQGSLPTLPSAPAGRRGRFVGWSSADVTKAVRGGFQLILPRLYYVVKFVVSHEWG